MIATVLLFNRDLHGLTKKTILDGIEDDSVSEIVCYLKSDVERMLV